MKVNFDINPRDIENLSEAAKGNQEDVYKNNNICIQQPHSFTNLT